MEAHNSIMSVMRSTMEANKCSQQALPWLLDQQRYAEEPPAKRNRSANGVKQVRGSAIEMSLFSIRSCGFMLLSDEDVSRALIIHFRPLIGMRNSHKRRAIDPVPGILEKNRRPEPTANGRLEVVGEDGTTATYLAQFGPKVKLRRKLPGRSRGLAR